jgi:hypothetical protein
MKNIKINGQSLIRSFETALLGQSGHLWVRPLYVYGGTTITFDVWWQGQIWVYRRGIEMTMTSGDGKHEIKRSISYNKFWDCTTVSKWSLVPMTSYVPPSLLTHDGDVRSNDTDGKFKWQWVFIMHNMKINGQSLIRSFETALLGQSGHLWVRPLYVYDGTTITFDTWWQGEIWV